LTLSEISDRIHAQQSTNYKNQMKIKDAIKLLKEEEKNGVKNIILAYWTAEAFNRKDDSSWKEDVRIVDSDYDWSADQEAIEDMLESLKP